MLRRARDATFERVAIGLCLTLALGSGSFAAYTIAGSTGDYSVQRILPPSIGAFAWKKGVVPVREAALDVDPTTTGSLPDRPEARRVSASSPTEPAATSGGYVLRRVSGGVAVVEGPSGLRQVVPGTVLPGAGRILSIRATGAGWVVVTTDTIIGPTPL